MESEETPKEAKAIVLSQAAMTVAAAAMWLGVKRAQESNSGITDGVSMGAILTVRLAPKKVIEEVMRGFQGKREQVKKFPWKEEDYGEGEAEVKKMFKLAQQVFELQEEMERQQKEGEE